MWSGSLKEPKISMIVPKPQSCNSQVDGVFQYEPLQFVCSDKLPIPLAKESLSRDVNTESLKHKEG
jgi:hypothetical protein